MSSSSPLAWDATVPGLPLGAAARLDALEPLYAEWNAAINVISRKDFGHFVEHHVLHSLAVFRAVPFAPGSRILDVGTGGGFPGIPLAIACPDVEFVLVDSIGKKIKVVQAVASALGLHNVRALHGRAEDIRGPFDFAVSRAVARTSTLVPWVARALHPTRTLSALPNGLLLLKGGDPSGDLGAELAESGRPHRLFPISDWFHQPYFAEKFVVHLPR